MMFKFNFLLLLLLRCNNNVEAFTTIVHQPLASNNRGHSRLIALEASKPSSSEPSSSSSSSVSALLSSRAEFLQRSAAAAVVATTTAFASLTQKANAAGADEEERSQQQAGNDRLKVMQLPSGLKYIDLVEGEGQTPQYGQLVSIRYNSYIKLPASSKDSNPKPQQFDSSESDGWLFKHGNGRTVPGLDEGIHTLRVGGKRRLIIPPKLGYIDSGLGPIPAYPWDRLKLNKLLDEMVELKGGNLIMEVELLVARNDEADMGYYSDDSLTPEQFETLKTNLQKKAQAANAANNPVIEAAAQAASNQ